MHSAARYLVRVTDLSIVVPTYNTAALTLRCCRAVLDCQPELAYDVDSLLDLRHAERWFAGRGA